jgi:hypothetical protein
VDAIEHNRMTPKQMEQYNTAIKGARYFAADLPLAIWRLVAKYSRSGSGATIPTAPMLKEMMPQGLLADGRIKKLA